MTALAKAREYLRVHGSYLMALQALLTDLGMAKAAGDGPTEVVLCDALDELRILAGEASQDLRWHWPVNGGPSRNPAHRKKPANSKSSDSK